MSFVTELLNQHVEENPMMTMENRLEIEKVLSFLGKNEMRVSTPLGNLLVQVSTDPLYPGVFVGVEDENDGFVEDAIAMEYQSPDNKMVLHVWKKGNDDVHQSFDWVDA